MEEEIHYLVLQELVRTMFMFLGCCSLQYLHFSVAFPLWEVLMTTLGVSKDNASLLPGFMLAF